MATQSIFSNVKIKDKKMGKNFVKCLEAAKEKKAPSVVMSKSCNKIKRDDIAKLFGIDK